METRGDKSKKQFPLGNFFGPKRPSIPSEDINKSITGDRPESGNQTRRGLSTTPSIATSSATSFASGVIKDVGTKPKVQPPQRRSSRVKSRSVITPDGKDKVRTFDKRSSPNAEATTRAQTADSAVSAQPKQMTASTPTGFGTAHTGYQPGDNLFQLGTKAGNISKARATGSSTKATTTVRLEESLPDATSGIDGVIQDLLNTRRELTQANRLVDQLLQEIQKLQIAATEFCDYAQTEFTKNLKLQIAASEYAQADFRANLERKEQTSSVLEPDLCLLQQILCQISEGHFPSLCNPTWIPGMQEASVDIVIGFLQTMGAPMIRKVLKLHDTKNPTETTPTSKMSSSEFIDTLVSDKVGINSNRHADIKQDQRETVSRSALPPLSYQTIVCNISGRKGRKGVRSIAALDSNVSQTLVDKDTAVRLMSKRTSKTHAMKITMFGQQINIDSYRVELHLTSIDGLQTVTITAYAVQDLAKQLQVVDWSKEKDSFSHLQNVPFESLPSERTINLLIGYDHAALLESSEMRSGTPGQPIARLTPLGWTCSVSPDKI